MLVPVCTQFLHILPGHVEAELDIHYLSFVPLQGIYVLDFISYSSKYLLPPHVTLNCSHGEWTLAIHRFNICGFDGMQKPGKFMQYLYACEAHDENTVSLRSM